MFTQTQKTSTEHNISEKHDNKPSQKGSLPGLSLTQENIIQLQKTIGNRAVMQLLEYHFQQQSVGSPIQGVESENNKIDMLPDDAIQMERNNSTIQCAEIEDEIQVKHDHAIGNNTGLPDNFKKSMEHFTGIDLSDVKVHYNSAKPAELNALAYTQGSEIHVAPGQEKHLPHEAWHVVQQAQGRVKPTIQVKGIAINDDHELEREADMMGSVAAEYHKSTSIENRVNNSHQNNLLTMQIKSNIIQAMWAFIEGEDSKKCNMSACKYLKDHYTYKGKLYKLLRSDLKGNYVQYVRDLEENETAENVNEKMEDIEIEEEENEEKEGNEKDKKEKIEVEKDNDDVLSDWSQDSLDEKEEFGIFGNSNKSKKQIYSKIKGGFDKINTSNNLSNLVKKGHNDQPQYKANTNLIYYKSKEKIFIAEFIT